MAQSSRDCSPVAQKMAFNNIMMVKCWVVAVAAAGLLSGQNFILAAVYDQPIEGILKKCLTNGKGFPFKLISHEESDPSIRAFAENFQQAAQRINMGYSRSLANGNTLFAHVSVGRCNYPTCHSKSAGGNSAMQHSY